MVIAAIQLSRPTLGAPPQRCLRGPIGVHLLSHPCAIAAARRHVVCSTLAAGAAAPPPPDDDSGAQAQPEGASQQAEAAVGGLVGWWKAQQRRSAALRSKLVSLGPAAVLAYGMFDGLSYTVAFAIAFLGYEARTGLNPTANIADLVKICVLMWAGNNVTRPFRLAGAAALAPAMDRLMDWLKDRLRLPNKALAFAIVVVVVAGACFSVLGALFLSRWLQG